MLDKSQEVLSDIIVWSKYAKFIPEQVRRETWEEICERNIAMHIRKYPHLKKEIQEVYRLFVIPKKVLPSMRSMQFSGKPVEVNNSRIYNCFGAGTQFVTSKGVFSLGELVGQHVDVLSIGGTYRSAEVREFGTQDLYSITIKPRYRSNLRHTVEATRDHRWVLEDGNITTSLKVGDRVKASVSSFIDKDSQEYVDGFAHGVVFGDGTSHDDCGGRFYVRLCGEKAGVLPKLKSARGYRTTCYPPSQGGDPGVSFVVNENLKSTPEAGKSADYIAGFISGWLYCDGYKKAHTESWNIDTQDREACDWLIANLPIAGFVATGHSVATTNTNYGERSAPLNRVSFRENYDYFMVESIEFARRDTVYCVVEPVTKTFTLAGGILTGNCAYAPVNSVYSFSEAMFLLLGGTGYGYSVQRHHVDQLPIVQGVKPRGKKYLIADSIEGWADAIKHLMKAYFEGKNDPVFDFHDIRPKGARLITAGGKAPGPDPLRICIDNIRAILNNAVGRKLATLEAHDILCHIADAVLTGGIRRAAMIAFFSHDDIEMISCKAGAWYELNPQRGRANNSAVLVRGEVMKEEFETLWAMVEASGSGEPGVYWTNDREVLSNPCVEATLRPHSFCNLTTINASDVYDQFELNERAKAATFIGTLQAGYTDFHYLRDIWRETTEADALIGVSMTGIASGGVTELDLSQAAQVVVDENARVAALIGINTAARTTLGKPEGTASIVVGSSSGIHAWHNDYYIRRVRIGKNEAIHAYLKEVMPELIEDCKFKPHIESVASFPQKAPEGAILRNESALELLARVIKFNQEWIKPGHNRGVQRHNISCTISLMEHEWGPMGKLMWELRDSYNGISVLPYSNHTYFQAPFEDCTKEVYDQMMEHVKNIDVTMVVELEDATNHSMEAACAGNACEVK